MKNPRKKGTALDRVYSHHLQNGTLPALIADFKERTEVNPGDGSSWMILGLIEAQRRMDLQAIEAFAKAERLRSEDPLPVFYAARCWLRQGEMAKAIEGFEAAIQRNPSRMVLMDIYGQLGRTLQRQRRHEDALRVWKRMETQFPGDTRVVEQISWIQRQEGAYRPALERYEQLVALCKDDYQRTQYRMPSNHGSASDLNSVYYAENRNNIERATHSAVRSLQWLVDRWEGDPAAALPRYELLRTLVFPSDREEFVYADRNRLLDEAPVTVSEKLFKIATEVHRLDELKQMLNARESPIPSIPWTVLRTQFAMAERDFGTASRMLEKLLERSQTEKSHVTLLAACQVAVPAFKIEELRKPAFLILDEYVRRESASGSYPNTDFQLFPLVRMVSEYRQEQAGVPVENEK